MLILWSNRCQDWKMALHCKQVLGRHAHGPYGLSVVAIVVVIRVAFVRIEVEFPRVVRVAGVERRRPVVAVGTCVVELVIVAVAGGREENTTRFASAVLLFSRAKECLVQANAPIDAIPHFHCGPTAYELAFVCVFAIYRTADSGADCRVRLGGTLRVRRTRHSAQLSADFCQFATD